MIDICSVVLCILDALGPTAVMYYTLHRIDPQKTYSNTVSYTEIHKHEIATQIPYIFPPSSRSTAPAAHDMSLRSMPLMGMYWRWKDHELSPTWFSSWLVFVLLFCVFLTLWARQRLCITLCTELVLKNTLKHSFLYTEIHRYEIAKKNTPYIFPKLPINRPSGPWHVIEVDVSGGDVLTMEGART